MQRVVSIHLNGSVYQLEEAGYSALFGYLDAFETSLKDDPDRAARLAEIEHTIAGKCAAYVTATKSVVTTAEVARILSEIVPGSGSAADGGAFTPASASTSPGSEARASAQTATEGAGADSGAGATGAGASASAQSGPQSGPRTPYHKGLWQIRDGAMIGGVCLGLATFFNIDVTLIRVLFALFVFATAGWGILAYLALMFVLPRATSVAEASAAGPQKWAWETHGWPWDRPGWPFTDDQRADWRQQRSEWQQQRADWRAQRAEWRQQRRDWRDERRAARMAYGAPPVFGTIVLVFFVMIALGWFAFWMRGGFLGGWPLYWRHPFYWGGPFYWGFPHWFSILLFFVLLRFLLWPVWGHRWGWYGHSAYGAYHPYGPWMALWHAVVWIATIIFLVWLAGQFIPGFREFLQQFQTGWPSGRFDV